MLESMKRRLQFIGSCRLNLAKSLQYLLIAKIFQGWFLGRPILNKMSFSFIFAFFFILSALKDEK
jgi:hypothetical protein